jgi:FkbM family methyltransferase
MAILLPDEPGLAAAYADEKPVRDAYWHPARGDVVIDLGAAVGSYAVPALMAGARVIAVDPDAGATAKLERVAAFNGLGGLDWLTVVHAAVWDEPGYPPDMRAALEAGGYAYLIPRPGDPWTTLDDLAAGLSRLDWIKIDVEGAELGVLRSGRKTLAEFRPRMLIEDHTEVYPYVAAMDSRGQCYELLENLGYRVTEVPWGPPPRTYLICDPWGQP